ncbi:MAG: hypothetical protein AB7I38_19590 [Dehalococcoidia bacterium]
MAGGSERVAPLAAVVCAHDLGETESAELEHLAVEVLQLVEERSALGAETGLEVPFLAVGDKKDDGPGLRASSPSSGRRA